ncbi:exodeoxyribonuclease V subunit alpha [Thalassotalea atypica]|uniref:exodeoxyribonuclease V subunit alpha n=1 Tax=Thalassotalea atypica TaxID=2054316 RepID=UPI0025736257|nr:exodeoxyribonuclease V subunit alpha [Thalassotalea atypica]
MMKSIVENTTAVYPSYAMVSQEINEIAPIDYFFAKEMLMFHKSHNKSLTFHLLLALSQSARLGHTCLPIVTIAQHCFGFKSDVSGVITHHGFNFPALGELEKFVEDTFFEPDHNKPVCLLNGCLYMRRNFKFEQELQQQLSQRAQLTTTKEINAYKQVIEELFPDNSSNEIDWQKIAVANALNKKISIIAGGPGTGKTYTVTKLIAAIISLQQRSSDNTTPLSISLVAPTGKAAQRLSESIIQAITGFKGQIDQEVLELVPTDAQTLHRFLGVIPNQLQFRHHQDNKLNCDVLILDEVSMVDLALMTRLFRALPKHTQIIMLGDADQLPSVALGSVLADTAPKPHPGYSGENLEYLAQCTQEKSIDNVLKKLAKTDNTKQRIGYADHLSFLYKSRRFDGEGGIGLIANAVINSKSEASWALLESKAPNPQLSFTRSVEQSLPALVQKYYMPLLTAKDINQAFIQLNAFRVLCAARKGLNGVEQLNEKIAELLGKTLNQRELLYHGMPIMINENDYTLGLYNGDIGLVWRNEQGQLLVAFEDAEQGYRYIMPTRLPSFEPVYAMTIHKTQGSEFSHVYMVLSNQLESKLLSRELMYTGITRAKKHLTITATEPVWFNGVETKVKRFSNLSLSTTE